MSSSNKEPSGPNLWLEVPGSDRASALPTQGVLSIGSSADRADFVVDGQGVADVHCAIGRAKGGGWALKDLGSEYGTVLNGKAVRAAKLNAGDRIVLGSRQLAVVDRSVRERAQTAHKPKVRGFKVEQLLGRGAMGSVWLAVQENLDRNVALKVLAPKYAHDAEFVRQFDAEAKAAAALHHANVVTLFDVGEDGGQHYLTMEYMDRGNLESRLAGGQPLPVDETLKVLTGAARGLVFAEQKGIVHRDIKPANLMQNSIGDTKIADLGLATNHEAENDNGGKIFGTPHFIAPEQAKGERVDARSDLYSLGATAYRLLTGRTPFEGETTRDILRGHFFEEPPALSEQAPQVPERLATLVHRLLAKAPDDRPTSAAAVLSELEAIGSGQATPLATSASSKTPLIAALVVVGLALVGWMALRGEKSTAAGPGEGGNTSANLDPEPSVERPLGVAAEPNTAGPVGAQGNELTGRGNEPPTLDDDASLRAFERQAQEARDAIPPDLVGEARATELEQLISLYDGTDIAAAAREEIGLIRGEIAAGDRALRDRDQQFEAALAQLRSAAGLGTEDALRPGPAFQGLLTVELSEELALKPGFDDRRREVVDELAQRVHADVQAELTRIEALEADGRFSAAKDALDALLPTLDLPTLPEVWRVDTLELLTDDATAIRLAVHEHAWRAETFRWERERDDALAIAAGFGGQRGLEAELSDLTLSAANARLVAFEDNLHGSSRPFIETLARDCTAGAAALSKLIAEFGSGGWRRRAILDPRSGSIETVTSVDANGLKLENGGTLLWAEYGGQVSELEQLFSERLERTWNDNEVQSIATLLRLQAVIFAIDEAAEMFTAEGSARFRVSEAKKLSSGFQLAREWAVRAGATAALDAEEAAARTLAEVLLRADNRAWSATVAGLERLLSEYANTLVVRLLSDGRGFVPPAPERPAAPPQ